MNLRILLTALAVAFPAAAQKVERVVGATTMELEHKASGRKLATEIWYPPAGNPRAEDLSFRPPLRPLSVARKTEPASGNRPLLIVSLANWGSRYSHGWLALRLVDSGCPLLS